MFAKKLLALACVTALAGCGGGGAAPAPHANVTSSTPAAATPVATGTLTIKFPAGFHIAKHPAGAKTGRQPAYVNSNSYYLDVWVFGGSSPQHVVDTTSSAANVVASADGTQTLSIPLFSTANSQIVAYEQSNRFGKGGNLLAIGEADIGAIAAGSSPAINLTMLMNAQYIGVMNNPDDANGDATSGKLYSNQSSMCGVGYGTGSLYFFTADATGGFVDVAGVGGTTLPTLTSAKSDVAGNTYTVAPGVGGAFSATFNNLSGGVTVGLQSNNPAYAVVSNLGSYPGIAAFLSNYVDPGTYGNIYGMPQSVSNTIDILPNCPTILTLNGGLVSVPGGLDEATLAPAQYTAFPVLYYNGFTYWPFSFTDNRTSFGVAKYDSSFNYVTYVEFPGDRYISSATVGGGYVTFYGQSGNVQIPLGSLP
jgi:hypothetical protein